MNKYLILYGMKQGMENLGARFVKIEGDKVFFDIPKGSEIDNDERIGRAKLAFNRYSIRLMIRMTEK
jgi:hypothetical protein